MKQYLILLDWYEYNLTGIIKATNKIKALEKLINEQININRLSNKCDLSDNIPYFYFDEELTQRQNIANYLQKIRWGDVRFLCFEINSNTDGFINSSSATNYKHQLISIKTKN